MSLIEKVGAFLSRYCPSKDPLLLAFSGGPDSLCLFYCLLAHQKRHPFSFHVAHVDHGWRLESREEAEALRQLAYQHDIPFHLKTLTPTALQGNLEAVCRQERYQFFEELYHRCGFQGVLIGHHGDDQAESVLKRLLEGAHWCRLPGLKPETWMRRMRLLRPLLPFCKKNIYAFLESYPFKAFEDPTNQDPHFMRARMRQRIIPELNQVFGKSVQSALSGLAQDMHELSSYVDQRVAPFLATVVRGPWGIHLDLSEGVVPPLVEAKYLLRQLCEQEGFFLSRPQLESAAYAWVSGQANQTFEMGNQRVWVDRKRLFITASFKEPWIEPSLLSPGAAWSKDGWILKTAIQPFRSTLQPSSWKEGWLGVFEAQLPLGSYTLHLPQRRALYCHHSLPLSKWWNENKVPAFLRATFPVVWQESKVLHEFLSGKRRVILDEEQECLVMRLTYEKRC